MGVMRVRMVKQGLATQEEVDASLQLPVASSAGDRGALGDAGVGADGGPSLGGPGDGAAGGGLVTTGTLAGEEGGEASGGSSGGAGKATASPDGREDGGGGGESLVTTEPRETRSARDEHVPADRRASRRRYRQLFQR